MKDKRENQVQTNQNLLQSIATSPLMARASHLLRKKTSAVIRNEDSKMQRALLALQEIMPEAERLEIPVVIENHWGISSRPENILSIVEQVNSDYIGTCPDFDNFPKETDRYDGLKILASRALHVHAKSSRFMPNGEEKNIDFKRCMQILRDADYQNGITIEYEGRRDVLQGCLITGNLILKHWKRRSRKRSKQ